jgi:hypothetical protein
LFRYIVKWLDYIELDYDQRLHDQNDKRNEEKTMSVGVGQRVVIAVRPLQGAPVPARGPTA